MRTSQELFDTVVNHLRTQKQKSYVTISMSPEGDITEYQCLYHSPEGFKCSIGCLVPTPFYKLDMEGRDLRSLIHSDLLPLPLKQEFDKNYNLILGLQNIHDRKPCDKWEANFRMLA